MDIHSLLEKLGGEIVCGRAQVRIKNKYILLGRFENGEFVYTPDGSLLAKEHEESAPKNQPAKKKAAKKSSDK